MVAIVFLVASSLAYSYHEALLRVIMEPLHGQKLSYLTPAGGFSFIFQVSMYAGLLLAVPMLVYQLHAFIKPALPLRAQKSAGKIVLAASALIAGGVCYGYFVAIPAALDFLTTFASASVVPNLTADSYLSFFLAYVAGIAVLSLLPLILLFIHWIKPMSPTHLLKSERWIIAGAFIVSAVITPTPDMVNQTMIAVPIIIIYQIGVGVIIYSIIKQRRAAKRALTMAGKTARAAKAAAIPQRQPAQRPAYVAAVASAVAKPPLPATPPPQPIAIAQSPRIATVAAAPRRQMMDIRPARRATSSYKLRGDMLSSYARTTPSAAPMRSQQQMQPLRPSRPSLSMDGVIAPYQLA